MQDYKTRGGLTMKASYQDFKYYMSYECGTYVTEDGAVHCCECDEPIYESDFPNHNWQQCPVCEYNILEEEE